MTTHDYTIDEGAQSITLAGTTMQLFHRGVLPLYDLPRYPRIAIVGARACTTYGSHVASELAAEAAKRGAIVISGGAFGIDAAAHQGALQVDGKTVAVLASGVDVAYPRANERLFDQIATNGGALLSEYPAGSSPTRVRFLERNKIVAALADVVVLVEAAVRSGSLSTARHAMDLGRPLYVVPGPVTSAMSTGCHDLLKAGTARPITSIDDLEMYL